MVVSCDRPMLCMKTFSMPRTPVSICLASTSWADISLCCTIDPRRCARGFGCVVSDCECVCAQMNACVWSCSSHFLVVPYQTRLLCMCVCVCMCVCGFSCFVRSDVRQDGSGETKGATGKLETKVQPGRRGEAKEVTALFCCFVFLFVFVCACAFLL